MNADDELKRMEDAIRQDIQDIYQRNRDKLYRPDPVTGMPSFRCLPVEYTPPPREQAYGFPDCPHNDEVDAVALAYHSCKRHRPPWEMPLTWERMN